MTQFAMGLPSRPLDEVASRILDVLFAREGSIEGEPGTVLVELCELTDCNYFSVSVAVRKLEEVGFIEVARQSEPGASRGNRIEGIHIL